MIRINLLPVRAAQKKEKLRAQLSILVLCFILVAVGCGFLFVQKMFAIDEVKQEIATIDAQNNALKAQIGEVSRYEKLKSELEKKLEVLQSLKDGKSGPVQLLDQLSVALPDKLWLTSFSESGGNIQISGYGIDEKIVAMFMQNLENSPYYRNVELGVTEQAALGDVKIQKFSLTCQSEKPANK